MSKKPFVFKSIPSGSKSTYHLSLKMDEDEKFYAEVEIDVTNTSKETWNEMVLYFIPNMFTKENASTLKTPASVKIHSLLVDGKASNYSLEKDTLYLPLSKQLLPDKNIKLRMVYDFTLPSEGLRFTKKEGNFHLAQWYPMIPTYRNGWNKQEYRMRGETYHTPFSDFHVKVKVPAPYTIVSSSDKDNLFKTEGAEILVENEKEVFLGVLKDASPLEKSTSLNQINVRVFGSNENQQQKREVLDTAVNALDYFQRKFGNYPGKQFDVIIGGPGMEYPGVVTVGSHYNGKTLDIDSLKHTVVHEVAHQWFYRTVSNDPFKEAWLDEGFATISELFYYGDFEKVDYELLSDMQNKMGISLPVNLALNRYPNENGSNYFYGKASSRIGILLKKYTKNEKEALRFLKTYISTYKYKEVNTHEFVRFTKHYFNLDNNEAFEDWLNLSQE